MLVSLFSFVGLIALFPQSTLAQQSNVIVILSDDAGWADFGFQGSTKIATPNLDALAEVGVRFSNAYAGSVCAPSRASLLTGQYQNRFGLDFNIPGDNSVIGTGQTIGLAPDQVTMFDRMKSSGYTTGTIGKWHLGEHADNAQNGVLIQAGNRPAQQGIDEFFGILNGSRGYFVGTQSGSGALITETRGSNGAVVATNVESQYNGQYVTDVFGQASVDFIDRHYQSDNPFMLYTSCTAPHTPIQATSEDLAAIDAMGNGLTGNRRTYAAMQLAMDRAVGDILTKLDDPNGDGDVSDSIRSDTLIVFANDNGGDCCDSGPNGSSNWPLRHGKGSSYEGGSRVPMIIASAGVDESAFGTTFDAPVHLNDVLPTIVAAAGGSIASDETDGVDLLPHINGSIDVLSLFNGGIVAPGMSPGTLTIDGHYEQDSAGILAIEVAGVSEFEHDLLQISGTATLADNLEISILPGFDLQVGDEFQFLSYQDRIGEFDSIHVVNGLSQWSVDYRSDGAYLKVTSVPEPDFASVFMGLTLIVVLRRRKDVRLKGQRLLLS